MVTRWGLIAAIVLAGPSLGGCLNVGSGTEETAGSTSGAIDYGGTSTGGNTDTTGGTTGSGSTSDGGGVDPADPSAAATARILTRVNEERAAEGVAPLTRNAALDAAAAAHATDMTDNMFFTHTGSDGSTAADRVSAQGYTWSTVGENIAYGMSDADGVMNLWMNSPGHRSNILNPAFTEIGIAVDDRGVPYWVQVFAAPQ